MRKFVDILNVRKEIRISNRLNVLLIRICSELGITISKFFRDSIEKKGEELGIIIENEYKKSKRE